MLPIWFLLWVPKYLEDILMQISQSFRVCCIEFNIFSTPLTANICSFYRISFFVCASGSFTKLRTPNQKVNSHHWLPSLPHHQPIPDILRSPDFNSHHSFSISPSNEYSELISFRIDWFDLLVVQRTLKSLHQHHNLKVSILQCSAFFIVQFSHQYMTTRKTIALTIQTFVSKVTSLLFNSSILTIPSFICFLFSLKSSPFFQSSLSNQCFTQRQNYLS